MVRLVYANGSGNFDMADPEDNWPLPEYNPGPQQHLHALGAISTSYNKFESRLFSLFAYHLDKQKVSRKITSAFYFQGSETQRLENKTCIRRMRKRAICKGCRLKADVVFQLVLRNT